LSYSGGKSNAPTIRDDSEYSTLVEQLYRTKKSVTAVLVTFDMDQMEPYRVRASGVIDPRHMNWASELSIGTQVRFSYALFSCYLNYYRSLAPTSIPMKHNYMGALSWTYARSGNAMNMMIIATKRMGSIFHSIVGS